MLESCFLEYGKSLHADSSKRGHGRNGKGECLSGAEETNKASRFPKLAVKRVACNCVDGLEWIRERNPGAPEGWKTGRADLSLAPSRDPKIKIGLSAISNPVRSVGGDDVICIESSSFCSFSSKRGLGPTTSSRLADQHSKSHAEVGQPVDESMTLAFGRRPRLSCLNCTLSHTNTINRCCRRPRVAAVRSLQPIRVQNRSQKGGAWRHALGIGL
ncbi:hypothetical protein V8C35DRAFT_135807 [Trichoderma chlorosporum]